MSYILEALRRAQKERKSGRTPDLREVWEEPEPPKRRNLPWILLGGALLVNAVVVAAVFWPESKGQEGATAEAPPSAAPPAVAVARAPASTEERAAPAREVPVVPVPPPAAAKPRSHPPDGRSLAEHARVATAPESPPEPAPAPTAPEPEPAGPVERPATETPEIQVSAAGPVEEGPAQPPVPATAAVQAGLGEQGPEAEAPEAPGGGGPEAEETPIKPGTAAGSEIAQAPQVAAPREPEQAPPTKSAKTKIPLLRELPFAVQQRLGELALNVHVYSEDPERRFVFINMESHRTGERIGDGGPKIEAITPDGVILDYGEGKVRLQVEP